jgi:hypothetical protein
VIKAAEAAKQAPFKWSEGMSNDEQIIATVNPVAEE